MYYFGTVQITLLKLIIKLWKPSCPSLKKIRWLGSDVASHSCWGMGAQRLDSVAAYKSRSWISSGHNQGNMSLLALHN